MWICVEKTILENLLHTALDQGVDQQRLVQVEALQGRSIRQAITIDPFHRQDFTRCEVGVDLWYKDVRDSCVKLIKPVPV